MNDHAKLLGRDFESFVRMAFRDENGGQELGDEPYIAYVCRRIAEATEDGARCVVNMPPRHLKTFIGSVCPSAWLLARNPAEKMIIVTYSEQLARDIAYRVRRILRTSWYKKKFSLPAWLTIELPLRILQRPPPAASTRSLPKDPSPAAVRA
jgi:hypothetical protein